MVASKAEKQRRRQLLAGTPYGRSLSDRPEPTAEAAANHISLHSARVAFGLGVSEGLIRKAEERLGLPFPPSYRWWLRNYGAGYIGSYELNGLADDSYEKDATDWFVVGDIVHRALCDEANGGCEARRKLELLSFDGDEVYYFDTTQPDAEGEYPIFLRLGPDEPDEPYAGNFYEFLLKVI